MKTTMTPTRPRTKRQPAIRALLLESTNLLIRASAHVPPNAINVAMALDGPIDKARTLTAIKRQIRLNKIALSQ